MEIVGEEGGCNASRTVKVYNLDAVILVGHRVNCVGRSSRVR